MAGTGSDGIGPWGGNNMLRIFAIAGVFAFLIAVPVLADGDHGHHERGGHHDAPEPLTMIALGAGGASVAYAGWKKRRGKG